MDENANRRAAELFAEPWSSLGAARRAGPFVHGASNAGSAGCLGLL